jgi:hypothetical protein
MSEMFDGIDTETLRTLHRQIGNKAIATYSDAAAATGTETFDEIMAYGRQLAAAADLISDELGIRHQIVMVLIAERQAALNANQAPQSAAHQAAGE